MWTEKLTRVSRAGQGAETVRDVEQVRQLQQALWYVLTVIAVAEMIFGAWAVGLIR
ncbi:MAG: hypothetical protein ACO1SX_10310 [Actinomycetota bacterium]